MKPQEIEQLLQDHGGGEAAEDADDVPETPEATKKRTELLQDVLISCQQALASNGDELQEIAEVLGNGSRDAAWRVPYGESGILSFFLDRLADNSLSQAVKIHSLRIIGNSCADANENRARLVQDNRLAVVIRQLDDERVIQYSIPVLYNIMVDYEPAQKLASETKLSQALINRLQSPNLASFMGIVPYFGKILALLVSQDGEAAVAHDDTVSTLLSLAPTSTDEDEVVDFIVLVAVAAAYLASERCQRSVIAGETMSLFLNVFYHANVGIDESIMEDQESATELKQLRTSLLNALSELSANDSFTETHPLSSPVPQTLLSWLKTSNAKLQAAACLALGNLARSDEASTTLVKSYAPQTALAQLLSNPAVTDAQLLHSVLSFLKNLAIPADNKALLGEFLEPTCVPRIYALDTLPHVQYAAASLTRLLLVNCPDNVRRLCASQSGASSEQSSVNDLIALFGRSDAEPTKVEAARSLATICRVLHSADGVLDSTDGSARATFYEKHNVAQLLAFLITQEKWPILRSEMWFVLALMCRSPDGAKAAAGVLQIENVSNSLKAVILGADAVEVQSTEPENATTGAASIEGLGLEPQQVDPKQKEQIGAVERENSLVMCTELLRHWTDEFHPLDKGLLESLVKGGTEIVAADRAKSK